MFSRGVRSGIRCKYGRLGIVLGLVIVFFVAMIKNGYNYFDFYIMGESNHLLDTTFDSLAIVEIATFNTSMASLMVIDIASRDPLNRSHVHINRRMLNADRNEIFITELALRVPSDITQKNPFNTSTLSVDYEQLQPAVRGVAAPPFATGSLSSDRLAKSDVLIIGLGGSQLNNFLHYHFPNMNLTVIELEPTMVEIARRYFGLIEDQTQRVIVMDGLKFLQEAVARGVKYDAIYIDACPTKFPYDVEVMCPIPIFLDEQNIELIRKALRDTGTLSIKMLLFSWFVDQRAEKIADIYRKYFANCAIQPMLSTLNRVAMCSGEGIPHQRFDPKTLAKSTTDFYADVGLIKRTVR